MFFRALITSWGGILFGYKLAILSGINRWFRMPFTIDTVSEYLFGILTISGILAGVFISWLFSRRLGEWKTLVWVTTLYLITAIGSGLSPDLYLLLFFIGAGGVCIGGTLVTLPLYIMEVVPVTLRSRTIILFSLMAVLSIQLTYMLMPVYTINWRWIPGAEALVAFGVMLSLFTIPDQARLSSGRHQIAKEHSECDPNISYEGSVVSRSDTAGK